MTSPPPNRQDQAPTVRLQPQWPAALVAGLVGALAIWLAWPRIFPGPGQANERTLPGLDRRASRLQQITDPVKRDLQCYEITAFGRELDRSLAPDAHVFISGVLGKDNCLKIHWYWFLRNYLFPREVEISADRKPIFHVGWFEGVPYQSLAELRRKGFDVLLLMPTNDTTVAHLMILNQKGVFK